MRETKRCYRKCSELKRVKALSKGGEPRINERSTRTRYREQRKAIALEMRSSTASRKKKEISAL